MKFKTILYILFILSIPSFLHGQVININGGIGIGNIQSNSPAQTTLDFKVQAYITLPEYAGYQIGFGYLHSRKIENYLPEERSGRYYPYFQGVYLTARMQMDAGIVDFFYKGGGIILNDRMFSDRNSWLPGIIAGAGVAFLNPPEGITLSFEFDYAMVFSSNSPLYYSFGINFGYNFK